MSEYRIRVVIQNPETGETIKRSLRAVFTTNKRDYGNGTYLGLYWDNGELYKLFDLRYDDEFMYNSDFEYLCMILRHIWSGNKGSWRVIEIDNLSECYKVEYQFKSV